MVWDIKGDTRSFYYSSMPKNVSGRTACLRYKRRSHCVNISKHICTYVYRYVQRTYGSQMHLCPQLFADRLFKRSLDPPVPGALD